jgi:hypothetical protein
VNKKNSLAKTISNNNALTAQVLEANTIQSFASTAKHIAMSILLETATIKEFFPDFDGIIKSLGAWVAIL